MLASVILLLTVFVACHRIKRYPMQGEVVAKNIAAGEITVKHGNIPGFMMAMTMPYRVKNTALVQEIQPGDKIAAEVVVGSDRSDYWLEDVRITDESGRGQARPAIGMRMLMPGARVPDVALVNQDGRTIHLSDFSGKALLVTFLYTRCPMPDYCPRLSSQFARIHEELKKSPGDYSKTHLLTISFDSKVRHVGRPAQIWPQVSEWRRERFLALGLRFRQASRSAPPCRGLWPAVRRKGQPDHSYHEHCADRSRWHDEPVLVHRLDLDGTDGKHATGYPFHRVIDM
jgi:Cu/Ag efflux protein CusF